MELTEGIIKSVESSFMMWHHKNIIKHDKIYIVLYKGQIFCENQKIKSFTSKTKARSFLTKFVFLIFWQGEYWQSCKDNLKTQIGYDVDFTATIEILPSHGLTSRFDSKESKKLFKDIAIALVNDGIITIEEYNN